MIIFGLLSINPTSGAGASQTFTMVYFDAAGNTSLGITELLLYDSSQPSRLCWVQTQRNGTLFFLNEDSNTAWNGPLTSGGSLENSQCKILGPGTTAPVVDINIIRYTVPVVFKFGFAGTKQIYRRARSGIGSGDSGRQTFGSWTVQ